MRSWGARGQVNCIAAENSRLCFTGGGDGTVKRWRRRGPAEWVAAGGCDVCKQELAQTHDYHATKAASKALLGTVRVSPTCIAGQCMAGQCIAGQDVHFSIDIADSTCVVG